MEITDSLKKGSSLGFTSSLVMTPSSFKSQLKKFPAEPLAFPKNITFQRKSAHTLSSETFNERNKYFLSRMFKEFASELYAEDSLLNSVPFIENMRLSEFSEIQDNGLKSLLTSYNFFTFFKFLIKMNIASTKTNLLS